MQCSVDKACPDPLASLCYVCEDSLDIEGPGQGQGIGTATMMPYSCALNQTDLVQNCNKFFVMQLIHRNNEAFFVTTRAGRVGYEGVTSIDCFMNRAQAQEAYEQEFYSRTGVKWAERYRYADAPPIKGKYQYVLMKSDNAVTKDLLTAGVGADASASAPSIKLKRPVEELIKLIYDPELYKDAQNLGLDTRKMPLGSLGKAQILKAYKILQSLSRPGLSQKDILELSSQYYGTIPTASGMSKLPPLDNSDLIKEKMELLESLDNLSYLSVDQAHDVYQKYLRLECNVEPVEDARTQAMVAKYLDLNKGAHAVKLKLRSLYSLDKARERTNYRQWETLHNKQLLWHGTRMSNVTGILTGGLKINPVGIPTTGKMFGNGLYFANSSTKSAGYLGLSRSGLGALFLCEVALGTTLNLINAQDVQLPVGKHSTWGQGQWTPDVESHIEIEDNVVVPLGALQKTDSSRYLNYDEFIVYDTSQIKLRYLVLVDYITN